SDPDERQQVIEHALLGMEHHRPYERDRNGGGHHRQDESAAEESAQRELLVEHERRGGAKDERPDDREQRKPERVRDRLEEALVGRELGVVGEPREDRRGTDLPVEE